MLDLDDVDNIIYRHLDEASEGIVDVAPSRLRRGQAVEKDYFILKIDLAKSTFLLRGRHKSTYLKIIHTFLSTVDYITQYYGADADQTEYAGDSVLAYFPAYESAENVLYAAFFCKLAVERLASLQRDVELMKINCRIVIHFATLIVAKIGPRAGSILSAIGHPIHRVAKLEKEIEVGAGRATKEFYAQLPPIYRKYLVAIYEETRVPIKPNFDFSATNPTRSTGLLAQALLDISTPHFQPNLQVQRVTIGYKLNWLLLKSTLSKR